MQDRLVLWYIFSEKMAGYIKLIWGSATKTKLVKNFHAFAGDVMTQMGFTCQKCLVYAHLATNVLGS